MAVLNDIPGIEVAVQINGQDVVEYDDPDASEHVRSCATSSKYIESIDDAEFTIRYKASLDYNWEGCRDHVLRFRAFADGLKLSGKVIFKTDALCGRCIHVEGFSKYDPETKNKYTYNCKFSPISTVDDSGRERVIEDSRVAKKLGLIEVEVYRSTYSGTREPEASSVTAPHSYVLAEKSLKGKAISHGVSYTLGRITQAKSRPRVMFRDFEEDGGPIAVFRFQYRSKESLKQELIIPRSPSVPQSYVLRMTIFGEAELLQQAEDLAQWRRQIESDRVEKKSRPVKREISDVHDPYQDQEPTRPTKMSRLTSGREAQVIDLTDD
ncbi:hypothetical protein DL767_008602 [Monosporascus sp. MG133]|nr:hypothetical protein DL767_008602 [Monosporascus sp. MG133]